MDMFGLEISDDMDRDGEIEISAYHGDQEFHTWINKDNAIELINHLKNVFDIED